MKSLSKSGWLPTVIVFAIIYSLFFGSSDTPSEIPTPVPTSTSKEQPVATAEPEATSSPIHKRKSQALKALIKIPVKGRAPKTGYSREAFADDWDYSYGCDTRNKILRRDLAEYKFQSGSSCVIETGILKDPFTGQTVAFQRGIRTSLDVQIDHVVSLSDAWQKGAQKLTSYERFTFYNDPLNLLAVWGPANLSKSDADAASWLPPNKSYRCKFVARQIAVKAKYGLWVSESERDSMARVLASCPKQRLPN